MRSRAVNAPKRLVRSAMRRYGARPPFAAAMTGPPIGDSGGLLLRLRLAVVALGPLVEDALPVVRRPGEVVLGHLLEHVAGEELDGLGHRGDGHHRVALVVEPHGL